MNARYGIPHEYSNYTKSKTKQLNKYLLFQLVVDLLVEMYCSLRCYKIINKKILSRFHVSYRHCYISRLFITHFFFNMLNYMNLFIIHLRKIPRRFRNLSKHNGYIYSYRHKYWRKFKSLKKLSFVSTNSIVKSKAYILFIKFLFLLFRRRNSFINVIRSGKNVMYHIRRISNYLFFQRHIDILSNVDEKILSYDLRKRIMDAIFNIGRRSRKYRFLNKKKILNHITFNILLTTNRFDLFKRQRRNRSFFYYKLRFRQMYKSMHNIKTTKLFNKYISYINTRLNRYVDIQNMYLYQVYIFLYSYFFFSLNSVHGRHLPWTFNIRINGIKKYLNNFHYFIVGDRIEVQSTAYAFIKVIRKLCIAFALSQLFYVAYSGLSDIFRIRYVKVNQRLRSSNPYVNTGLHSSSLGSDNISVSVNAECMLPSNDFYPNILRKLRVKIEEKPSLKKSALAFAIKRKRKKLPHHPLTSLIPNMKRIKYGIYHRKKYGVAVNATYNILNEKVYNRCTVAIILLRIFKYYDLNGAFRQNDIVEYSLFSNAVNKLSLMHLKFLYNSNNSFDKNFVDMQLCISTFKRWLDYLTKGYFFNICHKLSSISINRHMLLSRMCFYNLGTMMLDSHNIPLRSYKSVLCALQETSWNQPSSNFFNTLWSRKPRRPIALALCAGLYYCLVCLIVVISKPTRKIIYNKLVHRMLHFPYLVRTVHIQNLFFRSATYKMISLSLMHSILLLLFYRRRTMIWKHNTFARLSHPYKFYRRRFFRFRRNKLKYFGSRGIKKRYNVHAQMRPTVKHFFARFFNYKTKKYRKLIAYRRNWQLLSKYFNFKSKYYLKGYPKWYRHPQRVYLRLVKRRPRFYNASRKYTRVKRIYFKFIGPVIHSTRRFIMNNSFIKATYATLYGLWIRRFFTNKLLNTYKSKYTATKLINILLLPIRRRYLNKSDRKMVRFSTLMLGIQRKFFRVPYKKAFRRILSTNLHVYLRTLNNMYTYIRYMHGWFNNNAAVFAENTTLDSMSGLVVAQTRFSSAQILNMLKIRSDYYANISSLVILSPLFYICINGTFKFILYDLGNTPRFLNLSKKIPSSIRYLFNVKSNHVLGPKFR